MLFSLLFNISKLFSKVFLRALDLSRKTFKTSRKSIIRMLGYTVSLATQIRFQCAVQISSLLPAQSQDVFLCEKANQVEET